jgi:hypothetical protein
MADGTARATARPKPGPPRAPPQRWHERPESPGIYGIGSRSSLGPILVGRGMPVATVAPAALASTFAASVVGAAAYTSLALTSTGTSRPTGCST